MSPIRIPLFALAFALLAPACAGPRPSDSELAWQRGQCAQVVDRDAREQCLKRVDSQ